MYFRQYQSGIARPGTTVLCTPDCTSQVYLPPQEERCYVRVLQIVLLRYTYPEDNGVMYFRLYQSGIASPGTTVLCTPDCTSQVYLPPQGQRCYVRVLQIVLVRYTYPEDNGVMYFRLYQSGIATPVTTVLCTPDCTSQVYLPPQGHWCYVLQIVLVTVIPAPETRVFCTSEKP